MRQEYNKGEKLMSLPLAMKYVLFGCHLYDAAM